MFKLSLMIAAVASLALPAASFAAADPQPDLDAWVKAVQGDGLTCPLANPKSRDNTADHWIIEFRCASADDGRIAIFSKKPGVAPLVYNCATAKIAGLACADTQEKVGFPSLTADIRKLDYHSDCAVDQTRVMGISPNKKSVYLEVKCADNNLSGEVLQFDATTIKPVALIGCDSAQDMAGGCRIPGSVHNLKDVPQVNMSSLGMGTSTTLSGGGNASTLTRGMVPFP